MSPQRAFLFRSDAQNCIARFLIQRICLELHPNAFPNFKRVPQHQIFRLSIDGRALPCRRDPGGPDLDPPVNAIDVHKARAADHTAGTALYRCKHHRLSAFLLLERLVNQALKVFRRFHGIGNPAKNVFQIRLRNFPEELGVLAAHRLETNHGTFQRQRHDDIQRTGAHAFLSQFRRSMHYLASCGVFRHL